MTKVETVLIVDDDATLRAALTSKFELVNYRVLSAKDGIEGLHLALTEHPDLILLDLRMPKLDGEGMLDRLRADKWGARVPVIVLTNSDSGHTIYLNIKDSVQGYFVKAEVSLKDILEAVHNQIGSTKS